VQLHGHARTILRPVRALRFYGPGDLRLEEVPDPEPGPGELLVQVEVALTDGTDLKTFRRGHPRILDTLPAPFGHEFCGIDVATGRRVAAANSAPCGACPACHAGRETQCHRLEFLAGAYAELIVVPERIAERNLHPVPGGLAPEVAALLEPLACCLHGVERADVKPGNVVAVLGVGPIGLMLCACVADAGGWPVTVGGRPERHRLAPAFGARPGDPHDADVVIEAAGTEHAWRDALELVRPGGTVVFFGGLEPGAELPVDAYRLHYEELTLRGSFHHAPRHVRAALAFLASGAYPWERLLTHDVLLEQVPGLFADPPDDLLKAVVRP
jgi:L-iditol 2-dehydrogenase